MRNRSVFAILFTLCLSASLFAQTPNYTITPDRGPVEGGTQVTISGGEFGAWPYSIIFGGVFVPATRLNETTLVATTPAHLPGTVPITIFEYDFGITTNLTFTFEGDTERTFERLLLPVFIPPIQGAFGSVFNTDLLVSLTHGDRAEVHGLRLDCVPLNCGDNSDAPLVLTASSPSASRFDQAGTPGQFIFVKPDDLDRLTMNLRAYDSSRAAENFGTELPVVREDDFFNSDETIALVGVPSDPRFRNTLRIYTLGSADAPMVITIDGDDIHEQHSVHVAASEDLFHPGYAEFSNFPKSAGVLNVRIQNVVPRPIQGTAQAWAFISVTNNETQHITTITPQP